MRIVPLNLRRGGRYRAAMKPTLIAVLLIAATGSGALAGDYAPQEFDFAGLSSVEHGVVEALPAPYPAGLGEVFEHSINPQTELVVQLEDGSAITIEQGAEAQFQAGDRVTLMNPFHDSMRVVLLNQRMSGG